MAAIRDIFQAYSKRKENESLADILVIAAHPDDEVVGAGAFLRHISKVHFLHITDGSPRKLNDAMFAGCDSREAYARLRRGELIRALGLAGFGEENCSRIGVIDQEASLNLPGIACRIATVLRERQPAIVLTHAFEGGHPDHDATAFAVRHACKILGKQGIAVPKIVEYASYHGNGIAEMVTYNFLPFPGVETWTIELDERDREVKREMMGCFKSQIRTLSAFPIQVEVFRYAPDYDFLQMPHEGVLFYEFFEWGMSYRKWVGMASEAMDLLGTN